MQVAILRIAEEDMLDTDMRRYFKTVEKFGQLKHLQQKYRQNH